MKPPVLEVHDLAVSVPAGASRAAAVDGVSFSLPAGETLALVGESGCGKSLTALALLDLLPPGTRRERGRVVLAGAVLEDWRGVRGRRIGMVFQEPQSALNPVMAVGEQVAEVLRLPRGMSRGEARREAVAALARVGIPDPEDRAGRYPHELSGGMRQRAVIAMALAGGPSVLLADEPTTALDTTVQAQVLDLLRRLRDGTGMAVLLVTHDLGVAAASADRVAVMYAGRLVETGPAASVLSAPAHPYTRGLLASRGADPARPLSPIPGQVPTPGAWPSGCPFHPRCALAEPRCAAEPQAEVRAGEGRTARCWKAL